jgi:hypothetical protein
LRDVLQKSRTCAESAGSYWQRETYPLFLRRNPGCHPIY